MPKFLTLDDIDPAGKTVLLRADLNVPMQGRQGQRRDPDRAPGADHPASSCDKGARVVVMSHFGRPKGSEPALSLAPVVPALSQRAGRAHRRVRRGLHRPDGAGGGARAGARRGRAAGKSALPRGEKRRTIRASRRARGARRHLCQRRVLGRASRPCLDRGDRASSAGGAGPADAGRARGARARRSRRRSVR